VSATGKVNPLHLHGALPRFDLFETELVVPGVRELLVDLETHLAALEADLKATNESDWSSLIDPLETLSERLGFAWGLVGHLMGVQNSRGAQVAPSGGRFSRA